MKGLKPVDFKAVAAKGAFVYCYLRKDGTPYYVGMASFAKRPFERHSVAKPSDRSLIRVLRSGLSTFDAFKWEMFYIHHFGRKDLGTGILRNLTDGGEGCTGHKQSQEHKERIASAVKDQHAKEKAAGKSRASSLQRQRSSEVNKGKPLSDQHKANLRTACETRDNTNQRMSRRAKTAAKYGVTVEAYSLASPSQLKTLSKRWSKGLRGSALTEGIIAA